MAELPSKTHITQAGTEEIRTIFASLFDAMENRVNEISIDSQESPINGRLDVHQVRAGMRLFAMNVEARRDFEVNLDPATSGVFVSLVLDGSTDFAVQAPAGRQAHWELASGRSVIGTFQPERSRWTVPAAESHRFVELQLSSGRASKLLSEYLDTIPGELPALLAQPQGFPQFLELPLTLPLRMIARQVLNCPLEGYARRLFMESKTLEILALQLQSLSSPTPQAPAIRNKQERERLDEARLIIEKELADPPSLMELSRWVGLNDFKLKRGFRELYQTTVFGYVRMLRMEKARSLLEKGDMNVSEVASLTGYTCFSHFSEAFRKQFGVSPRDLKKNRRC